MYNLIIVLLYGSLCLGTGIYFGWKWKSDDNKRKKNKEEKKCCSGS